MRHARHYRDYLGAREIFPKIPVMTEMDSIVPLVKATSRHTVKCDG
jgi:hypothetical protein